MTFGFQITCANKTPSGMIVRVGGDGWSLDTHEAIVKIISSQIRLNVRIEESYYDVGVRGEGMNAYLALEPDGQPLHTVDGLQSC